MYLKVQIVNIADYSLQLVRAELEQLCLSGKFDVA